MPDNTNNIFSYSDSEFLCVFNHICVDTSINVPITDITTKLLSKVSPDSQLDIYANLLSYKRGIAKGIVEAKVSNLDVCKGEFTLISPHYMPIPKIN